MEKIECEQDAITWVSKRLPILVKSKWSKRKVIYPFANKDVSDQIAEHLGKELWKLLNQ